MFVVLGNPNREQKAGPRVVCNATRFAMLRALINESMNLLVPIHWTLRLERSHHRMAKHHNSPVGVLRNKKKEPSSWIFSVVCPEWTVPKKDNYFLPLCYDWNWLYSRSSLAREKRMGETDRKRRKRRTQKKKKRRVQPKYSRIEVESYTKSFKLQWSEPFVIILLPSRLIHFRFDPNANNRADKANMDATMPELREKIHQFITRNMCFFGVLTAV